MEEGSINCLKILLNWSSWRKNVSCRYFLFCFLSIHPSIMKEDNLDFFLFQCWLFEVKKIIVLVGWCEISALFKWIVWIWNGSINSVHNLASHLRFNHFNGLTSVSGHSSKVLLIKLSWEFLLHVSCSPSSTFFIIISSFVYTHK